MIRVRWITHLDLVKDEQVSRNNRSTRWHGGPLAHVLCEWRGASVRLIQQVYRALYNAMVVGHRVLN